MKKYILKPTMTFETSSSASARCKPHLQGNPSASDSESGPGPVTAPQPLPSPTLSMDRPSIKLGLDVHLEFITAVVQRGNLSPQAPRKFTPDQLVDQVARWVVQGLAVYCVQEYHSKV